MSFNTFLNVFKNGWFEVIEGFKVITPEPLMLLKLDVEKKRSNTLKGFKDRCDIISLLVKLDLDTKLLDKLFKKYGCPEFRRRLIEIVKKSSEEYKYALQKEVIPSKLKKLKRALISRIV